MIDYASPGARFEMAGKAIEELRTMAMTLQEIGSYSAQDEQALKLLILNLANAMSILDPARSDALLRQKAEEYAKLNDPEPANGPIPLGQYL